MVDALLFISLISLVAAIARWTSQDLRKIMQRQSIETDVFYLQRLDLFPELLNDWEQSVDKKILVAPSTRPRINGWVGEPIHDNSFEFVDEWAEAELLAASCEE